MAQKIRTFLMFEGRAEEAMTLYASLFPDSRIVDIKRHGPEGPGTEGSVVQAVFQLAGQEYMCIDSFVKHGFTFTPATSLFVTCQSEDELKSLAGKLGEGGTLLMPLDKYPFAEKFTWLNDRFGVSWQLIFNPR